VTETAPARAASEVAATALDAGAHVAGTVPYRWPWDGDLDPRRLALVIAGADVAWFRRSEGAPAVTDGIERTADVVRRAGGRVVHVAHDPVTPGHPVPARADAPGAAAAPAVLPHVEPDVDLTVVAAGIDGFFGSTLDQVLRREGRDHLLVAGFGLEGPVHSTLRSANDAGYECLLLTDLGASLDPACRDAAVSTVTMSGGIFGAVGTSPALCAALAPDHPESP
jgi:nicotinamidase-related amidase